MTCSSPSSKKIVVSLDTSDTINLNYLDVLPMQLNFGSLDKSIVNVDIDKQGISLNQYEGTENDDDDDEDPSTKGNKKGNVRHISQRSCSNGLVSQYYEGGKKLKKQLKKRIAKSTSHHHHQKQRQQQLYKPSQSQLPATQSQSQHNKQDSKAIASSSFDRYGRLTRVTANYADDYRTAKLSRKMSQIRRKKALNLSEMLSNTSREHLSRSRRGHRDKIQKTVAAKSRAVNVELDGSDDDDGHTEDKFSKEIVRQIRELGLEDVDGMKTPAAFAKLTQALKDLQNSWEEDLLAAKTAESLKFDENERRKEFSANTRTCSSPHIISSTPTNNNNTNNPLNINEIRKQDDLLTLCPTKIVPFDGDSSLCLFTDNNNINTKTDDVKDKNTKYNDMLHDKSFSSRNPLTQSDAIIFSKEAPGDYFRSSTPTPSEIMDLMEATKQQKQQSNNYYHSSMPELSEQKQVDIWNWVSSKCSGCQGQGLSTINQMSGDQDPSSMIMNFHDDDQTFSLCSMKDQDGSFTDGEGDEPSLLRKTTSIVRQKQQTINTNAKISDERLNKFVQEFLYNANDRTKLMGAALEKNKIIIDTKQGQGNELSCVALDKFDKQQKWQQSRRQRNCLKSSNSKSSHNSNNKSKSSESCSSEEEVDNDDENENEIPPPPTSTWNLSPLYEAAVNTSSECISTDDTPKTLNNNNNNIPNVSECSITPVVYSLASLDDVFSGEEIVSRCSTASTATSNDDDNFDGNKEQGKENERMYMDDLSEQRLLQLLGQYNKTEEQKKKREILDKLMQNIAATPSPSAKSLDDSSDKDWKQDENDKGKEEENEDENDAENKMSKISYPRNTEDKISTSQEKEISPKKAQGKELELGKTSMSLLKKTSSFEIKKSKKKKKPKKKKDKDDGESSGGEQKENKVKVKKPKAITLFKCDSLKIPGNGEDGTVTGDDGESPIQKLKNSLPRTPGGRFALRSEAAEMAIAEYVKAELAASLDVGNEAKLKPGKLRNILCSVSNETNKCHSSTCEVQTATIPMKGDKEKEQKENGKEKITGVHHNNNNNLNNNNSSNHHRKSQIPIKKKHIPPVAKKPSSSLKPPLPPPPSLPQRPLNCGIVPKQSNRINFIRYQQQSIAAMLNISRNRLRNQKPGYHKPLDRTVNPGFPRSQNPRELSEFSKKKEILNARLRNARNNVTVVFGTTHNLNNIQNNNTRTCSNSSNMNHSNELR